MPARRSMRPGSPKRKSSAPTLSPAEETDLKQRLRASARAEAADDAEAAEAALRGVSEAQAKHPAFRAQKAALLCRNLEDPAALAEAEKLLSRLIESGFRQPEILLNYAIALKTRGVFNKARTRAVEAIAARPDWARAYLCLAQIQYEMGAYRAAEEAFGETARLAPDEPKARIGLGHIRLGYGEVESGWAAFGDRNQLPDSRRACDIAPPEAPLWDPRDASSVSTLLWPNQGIGEQILYGSLAPEFAARTAPVGLIVDPRLTSLFQRSFPTVEILPEAASSKEAAARYERQGPVSALGPAVRPTAASFPGAPRPSLTACPERTAAMAGWLQGLGAGAKVGICWSSAGRKVSAKKSAPLARWKPILTLPGCHFVDLQYGDTSDDRAAAAKRWGVEIASHPELDRKDDFEGQAALIAGLDAVVSISTTAAHLAAALGKRTLVLVGKSHFWYWGYTDGAPSLWYPDVQVIRREDVGWDPEGWSPVTRRAAELLRAALL